MAHAIVLRTAVDPGVITSGEPVHALRWIPRENDVDLKTTTMIDMAIGRAGIVRARGRHRRTEKTGAETGTPTGTDPGKRIEDVTTRTTDRLHRGMETENVPWNPMDRRQTRTDGQSPLKGTMARAVMKERICRSCVFKSWKCGESSRQLKPKEAEEPRRLSETRLLAKVRRARRRSR